MKPTVKTNCENEVSIRLDDIIEALHGYNNLSDFNLTIEENGDLVIRISKEEQYWRFLGEEE
jgi:hypothetical protein